MTVALTIAVLLALFIDCRQTLQIKDHPAMFETNPALGLHPEDQKVIGYFLLSAAAIIVIVAVCPWYWGTVAVLSTVLALRIWAIRKNLKLGLHL